MRRSKSLVLLLALAAIVACDFDSGPRDLDALPGAGTNAADRSPPRARGGPLLAIGDSLLVGALEHGSLALTLEGDGWVPESIAERGRTVSWATNQIELRVRVPRYVVVVLGTNPGSSSAGFADQVLALRQALEQRGARRILWIPPHHPDPERYAEKIAVLQEADRIDRMLVVPDWGTVLDANPQWVSGDGLHLYDEGYLAMSLFIREQLARLG